MQVGKAFVRRNSFYKCVINAEETDLDSVDVFELAFKGKASAIDNLIQKSPEQLSFRDENGASPLHYASAGGNVDIIRLIVSTVGPEELNVQDEQDRTPLHWAVEKDQQQSCELLLELGADPNILNSAMMGLLHLAVTKRYNHLVEVLLSCDRTDVNLEGDLGNTPAMLACSNNNYQALHSLFKHGAKMCIQNKLGHYAIHTVAFAGAKEAMELVLKIGEELGISPSVHINYLDKTKSSPLHLAVRGGNIEVIKLCIIKGARVDQQQCDKSTALHFACTQGALEAVKIMLSSYNRVEDIINIRDGANQTPLHRATLFDHVALAEYLISKGAEIDCIDCKGLSPLLMASNCGAWKTVAFLLSIGADFKVKDKAGRNFLHFVILQPKGLKNLPETVLQCNAVKEMLSDEDVEGCTPLHYACKLGIHDSVKNMLGLNIFLGQKSREKKSALHFAAEYGRLNTCHRLLESITDSKMLNDWDEKGLTPLHLASRAGHAQVVELLLRRGALFQSDYKGWSCLHHAAAEGYTQTMKILLAANVKLLDGTNEDGQKCLISVCIIMVLVLNVYSICKELVQLAQQRIYYFTDFSNPADWSAAISSLVFVIPMCFNVDNTWQWQAGAFAILTSWIGFLLYFQRFERIGIYVVMFGGIVRTLMCIMVLFIFLLLAFGLSFYALMLHRAEFSSIGLALAQTFVMTVGELNYQSTFLNTYEEGHMAFPAVTYCVFVLFVLLMPILLMNLMIGLAVGDIAEVQRNAELKRIAMQIDLHTALEEKLPYWFLKRVDKPTITIYPNNCKKVLMQIFLDGEIQNTVRTRLNLCSRQGGHLERELHKQKSRMKAMSCMLEKQHNLLKLIIQKMEITSEADEYDGPQNPRALKQPTSSSSQKSKWVPLMQAIRAKK
ncbi:transient receptor potential cation channel subfamily A member 1b isoform X2 [Chanodichthys erythropterus]|uniref:transient receptor potential cation channel subfamily A member 1b isoform X2 n=1 Tax=Chanodichthys erythropterus TaxID=933992 RepID=UPI00351F62DA